MKHIQWLWWGLAVAWSLLLVQAIFVSDSDRSWAGGGLIWAAGLVVLVGLGARARRSRDR